MMRHDEKMRNLPLTTASYNAYGDIKWKLTDFFNNLPNGLDLLISKNTKDTINVKKLSLEQRYSIPPKLIRSILNQMINAYI